tara:strand:- start:6069 stop:6227 length:159 start_codon:yes stop_codon:yes gene_type:complete
MVRNIKKTKHNTYAVNILRRGNYVYCRSFKTLEEAIQGRDLFLKTYISREND